jgi:hypothetical protein
MVILQGKKGISSCSLHFGHLKCFGLLRFKRNRQAKGERTSPLTTPQSLQELIPCKTGRPTYWVHALRLLRDQKGVNKKPRTENIRESICLRYKTQSLFFFIFSLPSMPSGMLSFNQNIGRSQKLGANAILHVGKVNTDPTSLLFFRNGKRENRI